MNIILITYHQYPIGTALTNRIRSYLEILAKLDNSAKGGMAFAITQELDLPIIYAGLGEKADDLERFNREDFVNGIIGD